VRLLITGAGGFLGRYLVRVATSRGHVARALLRPESRQLSPSPDVEVARVDLRDRNAIRSALEDVDAVIHSAAVRGDFQMQREDTIAATESLLEAMQSVGVQRLVLISSLSVYRHSALPADSVLDESSPLESDFSQRDAYCYGKASQERLAQDASARGSIALTIIRPGAIFGPSRTFTAGLGWQITPRLWIRVGGAAEAPLTFVENCAEAIVVAAERKETIGQVYNVVDDERPTRRGYTDLLKRHGAVSPIILPAGWGIVRVVAALASATNRFVLRGRLELPGLLIPARVDARFKPLRYSNERVRRAIGWKPSVPLQEAMSRSFSPEIGDHVQPS
jgi:nucleoside-diphosphate-sugar epimerase